MPIKIQRIIGTHLLISHHPLQYRIHVAESDSRRTRSGWLSLLLDAEIQDEGEANEAVATGAVGTFDNVEGGGPISVAWHLRSCAWEGNKILSETNGEITENN